MAYTTLSLGLTLTIPTNGTRNWGTTLKNTTWTKISSHDHSGSGNGNQISSTGLANFSVTSAKLAKNIALFQNPTAYVPVGTTQTIDFNLGNNELLDLGSASGDVTLTLSNPQAGAFYLMLVTQGATARDLIWPANVKWPGAQKPILSTVNGAVDKIILYYNGTNYYGDWDLNYS